MFDEPQEPQKQNGKNSCLTVIGLALIVALVIAIVLQSMDTSWPFVP